MISPRLLILLAPLISAQSLDFAFYKSKVEPIFLKKRPGHARCVACHVDADTAFKLQPIEGSSPWTDEQSKKNFQTVSRLVVSGDPAASRLLSHTLAPAAGGDKFHGGGRQFASRDDPDWKTIADWIRGNKASN